MNKRNVIGGIIILAGICIFMYPIVKRAYSSYVQKQLMQEIKQAITDNMKENQILTQDSQNHAEGNQNYPEENQNLPEISQNPTEDTNNIEVIPSVPLDNHYADLTLVEEEQQEEESPEKTKERLRGQQVIGIIEIPEIDLVYAIVEGTSDSSLGVAIGHMTGTAQLGQVGNSALAGHRGGTSGPYFKHLDKLKDQDEIKITNIAGEEYIYKVTESFVVEPTDVWVVENTKDETLLTLITCTENGSKRLIVRAKLG